MNRALLAVAPVAAALAFAGAAHADGASARGQGGQTLTVSQADLRTGDEVTVTGAGFDPDKGIYVALCRDNGPGKVPTPCGGGADTSGETGGSQWISSNPPPYGRDLTVEYGTGGTFKVTLSVKQKIADGVDCAKVKCAIVSRADHTRQSDRTLDVAVPVTFGGGFPFVWIGGGIAILAAVTFGAYIVIRQLRS